MKLTKVFVLFICFWMTYMNFPHLFGTPIVTKNSGFDNESTKKVNNNK